MVVWLVYRLRTGYMYFTVFWTKDLRRNACDSAGEKDQCQIVKRANRDSVMPSFVASAIGKMYDELSHMLFKDGITMYRLWSGRD